MNEHPILFTGEMVLAILDGRKTQTRRVIKPQPILMTSGIWYPSEVPGDSKNKTGLHYANEKHMRKGMPIDFCPYGQPGDRLWVLESFLIDYEDGESSHGQRPPTVYYHATDNETPWTKPGWKPSIYMPRWASRITLEIVNVRVERVQEITDDDAIQEGVDRTNTSIPGYARTRFINLWNSINAKRGFGWDANPWVWAIEFKRVDNNEPS